MRKTYYNIYLSKRLIKPVLAILISLSLIFAFTPVIANADISGEDKLYGQTLTQRKLSVSNCPNVTAKHAALMDSRGNLIYERSSTESAKIASMTKIMTAIVGLENAALTDTLQISEAAADVGESSAGLWEGDTLTFETAIKALMVPSGNDAAVAIEEFVGQKVIDNKDSRIVTSYNDEGEPQEYITDKAEAFAKLMNLKAAEIGCINSYFTNPHGLDDEKWTSDAHSCSRDMIYITKYAMQNQTFRSVVGGGDCAITVTRNNAPVTINLTSTDILLGAYEGCIGVKTGVTDQAGACFSGAAHDNAGNEIYTVVMHSEDEATRFVDTQKLFDWYFENITNYVPATSTSEKFSINTSYINENGQLVGASDDEVKQSDGGTTEIGVVASVSHQDWADTSFKVTTKTQNSFLPLLAFAGNAYLSIDDSNIKGDYKTGDYVCDLVISQHNIETGRIELYAAQDQPAPNFIQNIGVWLDKSIRSAFGNSTHADTTIYSDTSSVKSKS